jgi:hypothetical protein
VAGNHVEWLQPVLEVEVDRVHLRESAPFGRRLVVRLALFAFCGGLLLLLSSRPAEAAERREPGLLDPVRTTLKATAREVDSFAGRATGSGASTVGQVADAARQRVAPPPRPATGVGGFSAGSAATRGAPAGPSPVRRAAPPARPAIPAAKPVTHLTARVARVTAPVTAPVADLTAPVAQVAAPVLAPVGAVLAPVGGPVAGLVAPVVTRGLLPLPGLTGPDDGSPAGAGRPAAGFTGSQGAAAAPAPIVSRTPARPVADGSSSPAARSNRSWPALTGAVSLPGLPASAELPAGGPDPLSSSSGVTAAALAALTAALLLLGPLGRGRTRPDRSGVLSRSYLPLVSPA